MKSNHDVIIVGGGIIGLASALYLSEKKASVKIIEKQEIGSGASHGNCGLLHFSGVIPLCSPGTVRHELSRLFFKTSPLYVKPRMDITLLHWLIKFAAHCNPAHMDRATRAKSTLLEYSLELYDTLFKDYVLECDLEKKGLLMLFRDKAYFEKYRSTNAMLENFKVGARPLTREETRALEPAVTKDVVGAWYNETDWHLRPEMLINALKTLLIEKGVTIEENCGGINCRKGEGKSEGKSDGIDFEIKNNGIKCIHTAKGSFTADTFILATGAWSPEVKKQLKLTLPVQPGKGYSITMERPEMACDIPCLLYERNMVATPWKTGYRLGGTMEFSGRNTILNEKRLSRLTTGAMEYLSTETCDPVLEQWTGMRPMTYDDLPIIDRSPFHDNLLIATGHGMLGVTMATGTGKAICDMICNGFAGIDLAPFSMKRF